MPYFLSSFSFLIRSRPPLGLVELSSSCFFKRKSSKYLVVKKVIREKFLGLSTV